jgi:C4-dicarboxylate-specific signal transduction histidine kinase
MRAEVETESREALLARIDELELSVEAAERRRRALLHIMSDLNETNRRLGDQRKAMLHILVDHEQDRRRLTGQAKRLDDSRRALIHILQDTHDSNLRLENSRKAMIHIMGDLRETTERIRLREQELREQQEQLIQVGKLATLGELTTGVAHELNNPLNNIGLFVGNAIDHIAAGSSDREQVLRGLAKATEQVSKATEIISHLRTFGRAAPAKFERIDLGQAVEQALSLMEEQLRLNAIEVELLLDPAPAVVNGNAIQLEQVLINLLTNARDALADAAEKRIEIASSVGDGWVALTVRDTGSGIPATIQSRIFDPFFTTKEVGSGTGLGLSIAYGIVGDHAGTISVESHLGAGATFRVELPLAADEPEETES